MPVTYRHHPTGGHSQPKGDYVDGSVKPLWPFGFGLSYTTFKVDRLRVDRDELATDGGELTVSVEVTNTGDRAGDEVVQLYVRDDEATVARPVRELRGFRRVSLAAGRVPDRDVHASPPSSSPTSARTTGASSSPGAIRDRRSGPHPSTCH